MTAEDLLKSFAKMVAAEVLAGMQPQQNDELLSVRQIQKRLRMGRKAVNLLIEGKRLPLVPDQRWPKVRASEVDKLGRKESK